MVAEIPALFSVITSLVILLLTAYRLRTQMAAFMLLLAKKGISKRPSLHLPSGIITRWRDLQTRNLLHLDAGSADFEGFTREG